MVALILLALLHQDDAATRTRALVERLGSDSIEERQRASDELVKLGPPALDAIKAHREKAPPAVRAALDDVLRRIDRVVRRERLLGPIVTVTIKADERPLREVLDELRTKSDQPLEWKDLPADPISVSLDNAPYWKALDEICRAHGGVMWRPDVTRTLVERGTYRALPKAFERNYVFFVTSYSDQLEVTRGRFGSVSTVEGGIAWTRGGAPATVKVRPEVMRDDMGIDLLLAGRPGRGAYVHDVATDTAIHVPVTEWWSGRTHGDATRLTEFRGKVGVLVPLDAPKAAELDDLTKDDWKHFTEDIRIEPHDLTSGRGKLSTWIGVELRAGQEWHSIRPAHFIARDARGTCLRAISTNTSATFREFPIVSFVLEWALPDGFVPTAIELRLPADVHELTFPFDFKDLPLR